MAYLRGVSVVGGGNIRREAHILTVTMQVSLRYVNGRVSRCEELRNCSATLWRGEGTSSHKARRRSTPSLKLGVDRRG